MGSSAFSADYKGLSQRNSTGMAVLPIDLQAQGVLHELPGCSSGLWLGSPLPGLLGYHCPDSGTAAVLGNSIVWRYRTVMYWAVLSLCAVACVFPLPLSAFPCISLHL